MSKRQDIRIPPPGFESAVAPAALWRNECAAPLMLTFALYRPGAQCVKLKRCRYQP